MEFVKFKGYSVLLNEAIRLINGRLAIKLRMF